MKSLKILVLITAVLLGGCRKEPLPTPTTSQPMFYVSCAINNVDVKLQAGNNGYNMLPGFSMDSNNVYVMEAKLENPGCSGCYALNVLINDHMTSMGGQPIHIDSALKLGHYLFNDRSLQPNRYSVLMKPEQDNDGGSYFWTISEPNQPDFTSGEYQFTRNFNALTDYTISLRHIDASGSCEVTHTNLLKLGAGPEVDVQAERQGTSGVIYKFSATSANGGISSYHWDFGDGQSSNLASPEHPFAAGNGYYTVTLTARDANGLETKSFYQIAADPDSECMANYNAGITAIPNTQAYSKVTIELKDPAGKIYSSQDYIQPAESSFEIVSIEDYKASSDGLKTKRFKALFNCVLKTGSDQIRITKGEAVLAIGYE